MIRSLDQLIHLALVQAPSGIEQRQALAQATRIDSVSPEVVELECDLQLDVLYGRVVSLADRRLGP